MFVVTDLVGNAGWQIHDKLFHLVTKAFATWDDPRREMSALLRALDLPASSSASAPRGDEFADDGGIGAAPGSVDGEYPAG